MTTLTPTARLDPQPIAPTCDAGARAPNADRPPPRRAAVTYPLDEHETRLLHQHLGPEWEIVDARRCDDADLVLMRPCSPRAVSGLRRRFPNADLIAIESDWAASFGSGQGPIGRALAAGLDGYSLGPEDLKVP